MYAERHTSKHLKDSGLQRSFAKCLNLPGLLANPSTMHWRNVQLFWLKRTKVTLHHSSLDNRGVRDDNTTRCSPR